MAHTCGRQNTHLQELRDSDSVSMLTNEMLGLMARLRTVGHLLLTDQEKADLVEARKVIERLDRRVKYRGAVMQARIEGSPHLANEPASSLDQATL